MAARVVISTLKQFALAQLFCLLLEFGTHVVDAQSSGGKGGSFTLINNCKETVWVGTQSNAGVQPLTVGDMLTTGQQMTVSTPSNWGGRFWGRTGCSFGSNSQGTCATGDCGGNLQCAGRGGKPPATLAEFTLSGANGKDFYDVSLVDGYNLPLAVAPTNGGQAHNVTDDKSCGTAGCTGDLNSDCPSQLQVTSSGQVVGCRSACETFNTPEYCCSGSHGSPGTCPATDYSKVFKKACPNAYSYAYDDKSSLFTCEGRDYTITFCPTASLSDAPISAGAAPISAGATPNAPISAGATPTPEAAIPEAEEVPSAASSDGGPASVNQSFRIITPSTAEVGAPSSWWLLFLVALVQLATCGFFVA